MKDIKSKQILSIAFAALLVMVPKVSFSDQDALADEPTNNTFGEIRFSSRVADSLNLSDSTTGNDAAVSFNNDQLNDFSSIGFAVGKKFGESAFYSFGFESFGSSNAKVDGFTDRGGTSYSTTTLPFDMKHVIAEVGVVNPLNETFDTMVYGGVGYSQIETDEYTIKTLAGTTVTGNGRSDDTSGVTYRIGVGAGYRLSEALRLVGTVQYTDYGEAFWMNDSDTRGVTGEIKATELGLRLVFGF